MEMGMKMIDEFSQNMIDWIAKQAPKMLTVFMEADSP